MAEEATKLRNRLKAVALGQGASSPARTPLSTCVNPSNADVPPCLHTLARPSFQTPSVFALRFFKLFVLTDQLKQVRLGWTAHGAPAFGSPTAPAPSLPSLNACPCACILARCIASAHPVGFHALE